MRLPKWPNHQKLTEMPTQWLQRQPRRALPTLGLHRNRQKLPTAAATLSGGQLIRYNPSPNPPRVQVLLHKTTLPNSAVNDIYVMHSPQKSCVNFCGCSTFACLTQPACVHLPGLRVGSNSPFQLHWFLRHIAGFWRAPVQTEGLKKAIQSRSEGWRVPYNLSRCSSSLGGGEHLIGVQQGGSGSGEGKRRERQTRGAVCASRAHTPGCIGGC